MLLHIRHETRYRYDHPVNYSIQNLRLTPRNEAGQRLRDWRIATPGRSRMQTDAYGNLAHTMTLDQPHEEIRILVEGSVETDENAGPWIDDDGRLPVLAFLQETPLTQPDAALRTLSSQIFAKGRDLKLALIELMAAIEDRIVYQPGATDVTCTAAEALWRGAGVCQDHAHVLIACARLAGLPARYVSGYLFTGDDGHLASHAWADVWDGRQWLSCDATHRSFTGPAYCRLAVGRDYLDACPVRGMRRGGGSEAMDAVVHVLQGGQ
jgi:transglutaminase-like putative cysteine protease